MKCKSLNELLEYEAKLQILHVIIHERKVQVQYVDYDNEKEVMR